MKTLFMKYYYRCIPSVSYMVKKPNLKMMLAPLLLGVVMLVGFDLSPSYGQSSNRAQVLTIPIDGLLDNLDCGGELIHATGTVHITSREVVDAEGLHSVGHINFAGVTGEGVNSGTQYQIVQSTSSSTTFNVNAGSAFTTTSSFQFIATGPDKSTVDVRGQLTLHLTVNANGEITAEVVNLRTICT
jgi:hypothetical protein